MISAQIKKGNAFLIDSLEDYLLEMVVLPEHKTIKTLRLNYHNFIESITQIISQYCKSKSIIPFNLFITDYFVRKYDRSSELYRHFFGFTQSWKRFTDSQEDAKLFLSLLTEQRNNKESVKRMQKIRKVILKTIDAKILEEIPVTHSDALTICHMIFEGERKNKVIKKINTLFISLKRKLVNTAKVNGAVACQFFMSAFEELDLQSFPQEKLEKQKRLNNDLSFSEQYKNRKGRSKSRTKNKNQHYREQQEQDDQEVSCGQEHQIPQISRQKLKQIDHNEWNAQSEFINLSGAKQSFHKLSDKDKNMDVKLQGYGLGSMKNYMNGWDDFVRNNQMQKQKLLQNRVKG